MRLIIIALLALLADTRQTVTSPNPPEPEYGHGLTRDGAIRGALSLFDGETTFGWNGAAARGGLLGGGVTTSEFLDYDLLVDAEAGGELRVGKKQKPLHVAAGRHVYKVAGYGRGSIRLDEGVSLRALILEPRKLRALASLDDHLKPTWRIIPHPTLPPE